MGYNLEGVELPHAHSPTFPTSCPHFPLVAPPDLQFHQVLTTKPSVEFKRPMAAMWSFNHSAIYRSLHLRLAIANDLSLVVGSQDRSESYSNVTRVSIQLLSPNAHPRISNKIKKDEINSRIVVRCTESCLDLARS
jgi:hypothetical protein